MAPVLLSLSFAILALRNNSSSQEIDVKRSNQRIISLFQRDDRVVRIKDDENVILFPTLSWRARPPSVDVDESRNVNLTTTGWNVPVHGWIHEPEQSSIRRNAFLSMLRRACHLKRGEEASEVLKRRARPFLFDNERGKALTIKVTSRGSGDARGEENRSITKRMPRSGRNGHFRGTIHVSDDDLKSLGYHSDSQGSEPIDSDTLELEVVQPPGSSARKFTGRSHLLSPTGLSVISDIDDTVKVSNVLDKRALMRNTFLKEFKAVPGMSALYTRWYQKFGASFHFVSSSPWQLYEELSQFFQVNKFPTGSFHLKSIRIKDQSVLSLLADPFQSKVNTIETIMSRYTKRMFVLVGDTGEKDPEVYGEICRRYPDRIWRVFLREVGKCSEKDDCDEDRFESAFTDVPEEVWSVFTDAEEVVLPSPPPSVR